MPQLVSIQAEIQKWLDRLCMRVILNTYKNISSTSAQSEVWRKVTNTEGWFYGHVQVPGWPLSQEPPEVSSYGALGLPALPNLHLCAPSVPTPTAATKKEEKERMCVWQALKNKINISIGSPKSTWNVKKTKTESCYWWWIFHFSTIDFTDSLWQRTQVKGLSLRKHTNMLRAL